jgi:hypothetical protein
MDESGFAMDFQLLLEKSVRAMPKPDELTEHKNALLTLHNQVKALVGAANREITAIFETVHAFVKEREDKNRHRPPLAKGEKFYIDCVTFDGETILNSLKEEMAQTEQEIVRYKE